MPGNDEHKGTSSRGFASMDQAKQRQIASKGGQSVPPEKRSFSQDPLLAAQAGRKGGESVPPEGRSFSQNRELAAEAGRKGGQARGASSRRAKARTEEMAAAHLAGMGESRRLGSLEKGHQGVTERTEPRAGRPPQSSPPGQEKAHAMDEATEECEQAEDLEGAFGSQDVAQGDLGQGPGRPGPGTGKEHPHGTR